MPISILFKWQQKSCQFEKNLDIGNRNGSQVMKHKILHM